MSAARRRPAGADAAEADVVVIGSGMGGATTAWALARRGVRVLLLERGDWLPREPENWSPQAVFIDQRYRSQERWWDGEGRPFRPGVHAVVGGSTKVYGASLPRLRESDFEAVEHAEGISPAWPIRYRDLEPYYAEAEALYRVHGATGEDPTEPWRSAPYPHPALPHEPYVADLHARLRAAGVHPSANAMGVDLGDGGACVRCATCDGFVCRLGAKSDAETCAIAPALASGNLTVRTRTTVRRLVAENRRVTAVVVDSPDGVREIRAGRFVLSAGAVLSAALLLTSDLAGGSGQLGRNFMMHNNTHLAAIDLDRRNDVVFQKTLSVNDFYVDIGDGTPGGTLQLIGKVQGLMIKSWATRTPLWALDLVAGRSVEWLVMSEDLPSADNRVVVDAGGRITVRRTALGMSTHRRLLARARSLLRECGYHLVGTQPFDISMNSHQCGTTVMGESPVGSVLDPLCRVHDLTNLWVVDGGFFRSSAAMNPALTIAAQSLRVVAESDLAS
ncbi:MAG: FAD-dependent oxidoreductase [Nocardioides sp.]